MAKIMERDLKEHDIDIVHVQFINPLFASIKMPPTSRKNQVNMISLVHEFAANFPKIQIFLPKPKSIASYRNYSTVAP